MNDYLYHDALRPGHLTNRSGLKGYYYKTYNIGEGVL
eukprot:SAG11_NODE_18372_length_492_cov_3.636132_1_plen_36_part_01